MTMGEDEDTIMGEALPHAHPAPSNHQTTDGASKQGVSGHLNGGSDPYLAPPLLSQPVQMPVITQSGNSMSVEASISADKQVAVPSKDAKSSAGPAGSTVADAQEQQDSVAEENSDWSDDDEVAHVGLPLASLPSGLCYDVQMRYHCEVRPTSDVHPEDPRRIYYIFKELCRAGLVDDIESTRPLVERPLRRINARNATEEEISLVHTTEHYAFVESTKGMDTAWSTPHFF
jgi:histone deacetylase 6